MGNWRISGFTGAIFRLTESSGFRYWFLACCLSTSIFTGSTACLVGHLADNFLFWRVCVFVSHGYLIERLWPDFTYLPLFPLSSLPVITLLLMLEGIYMTLLFYSPLILI